MQSHPPPVESGPLPHCLPCGVSTEGANSTDLKLGCDPRDSHPIRHLANVVDMARVTTSVRQRGSGKNTAKDIALVKCDRLIHLSTTTQMDFNTSNAMIESCGP